MTNVPGSMRTKSKSISPVLNVSLAGRSAPVAGGLLVFFTAEAGRPAPATDLAQRTILKPVVHCLTRRYTPYRDDDLHDSFGQQQDPPLRARREAPAGG